MIPRLLTFLLPPVIGLGASYAFAPIASGMLPPDRVGPAMVQAAEVPSAEVWDRLEEIELAALAVTSLSDGSETVSEERGVGDLAVFAKPQADAGPVLSRVMSLGRFKTRVERDGTRHNLSVDLAFEFETHEAALAAYDSTALMRLRDVALNAVVAAGQDERVYRSGFGEGEILSSVEAMVISDLPEVVSVHLIGAELREGPARTAMTR